MLNLFAAVILSNHKMDEMPFQIIPRSQFKFKPTENSTDSPEGEPSGMFVVNDEYTTNETLDILSNKKLRSTLVELVRKREDGQLEFWKADGKRLARPEVEVSEDDSKIMKAGEVFAVIDNVVAFPDFTSSKSRPRQALRLRTARSMSALSNKDDHFVTFQRLGTPTSKFLNVRFQIDIDMWAGSLQTAAGSTATVDKLEFKVVGPIENPKDKFEHLELWQSELLRGIGYHFRPTFDWDTYEKANGKSEDHSIEFTTKPIKLGSSPSQGIRIDFSIDMPMKLVKCINIIRFWSVDGYFGHVATEPIGN